MVKLDKMATKKKKATPPKTEDIVSKVYYSEIENFGRLGKRLEIGANAKVTVNKPGAGVKFHVPSIDILIGIGKDNVANLVMTVDDWEALKKGAEINIDTLKTFKKKFL